jgi:hypothetical protein
MIARTHCMLLSLLICASLSGCGTREAAEFAPAERRATGQGQVNEVAEDAAEAPRPSEPQRQAIETIAAAGGTIERDAGGWPTSIDLASERASANEPTVQAVLQFPQLQRLRLAVNTVAPETLSGLAALTGLRELMLQDAPIDDDQLAAVLRAMPDLRRLTLRRLTGVTDQGIAAAVDCPQLEVLALIEMSQIGGAALDALPEIAKLRSLDLRNCGRLTSSDFEKLTSLTDLTELKLGGPAITDDVLAVVARMPALNSLTVEDAEITGDGLQELARAPGTAQGLQSLSLARCFGVTDDTLEVVNRLPGLETLVLRDIMLTGTFLSSLDNSLHEPLGLRTLVINDSFVADPAVQALPKVAPRLERLDLRGNPGVTDQSLDALRQLPALKEVSLQETGVSDPTAEL